MTVLFRADLQNTLTPEVGTYDNTSEKTGSFGLDGGEYYLQNSANTKGYYFYYLASGSDNSKLTITFDIAIVNSSSSGWSVLFSGSDSNWWGLFTSGNSFSLNTKSGGDTSLGSYSTSTWHTVKITQEVSLGVLKIKLYIDDVEKADISRATNYAITNLLLLGNTSTSWTAYGTVLKNVLITDGEEEEEPTPSGVLKYLNLTGLSNLVTNIKNWVTALIPTKTSEITNDSGFITSSSLPTVNNATLTIQKNGTNVQTFTANASSNVTANIAVPTKTSDLTNDSGFLTSSDFSASYVTLNTQQNISANKFFYGGAWRVGSNYPSFICKNDTHTVGEAAPSSMWGYGEVLIQDKNAYSVCLLSCRYDQNATQYFRIECRNKFTNGAPAVNGTAVSSVLDVGTLADSTRYVYWNGFVSNVIIPRLAFAWNIGDGNYPWNIVYAANYKIKSANTQIGVTTSNSTVDFIDLIDANNTQVGYIGRWQHNNGYSCITLTCYDKYDGAGNRSTSGTVANGTLEIGTTNTGVPYLNYNTYFMQNISPLTNDNNDLGDTSHHWRNLFIGEMHCYHQNALMTKWGGYTFLLRNDGSYIWFLISEANGNEGTWSGLRPLYINCANGECTSSSKWVFNKSFGDGDPSVLIQSGTAYANGTWNYPLSALAPNMKAGANIFMPIGRSHSTGNCAGWHFYYAGNNSNDNFLSVEFYASGSPFAVYKDGRVVLSVSPAASDNSTRVATTAFVKANAYTHPTSAGNKHIPSGGSTGQILRYSASGTAAWANRGVFVSIANRTSTGTWTVSVTNHCVYLLIGSIKQGEGGGSVTVSDARIMGGWTYPSHSNYGVIGGETLYTYSGASKGTTIYFRTLIFSQSTSITFSITASLLTNISLDLCV